MVRRVGLEGLYGAELLGECDILRPWQGENGGSATLATTTGWSVLAPTRIAVLDADFARQMAHYPELVGRLRRTGAPALTAPDREHGDHPPGPRRRPVAHADVASGGRWGRVRSDGTMLPVRLTHASLADLVAARRPTVTSALSDLTRRGLVRLVDDGWLLSGRAARGVARRCGMTMERIG